MLSSGDVHTVSESGMIGPLIVGVGSCLGAHTSEQGMTKQPRLIGKQESKSRAEPFGWVLAYVAAKKPVVKFLVLSVVLVLVFWIITAIPFVRLTLYPGFLDWIAGSSAWLLRRLGEDAQAYGDAVQSSRFSLTIKRGCDALDPIGLFAAATLAFPVRWRARLIGILMGVTVLLTLNYVRIISLYYIGIHAPDSFETAHVDVWQPLFVLCSVVLWICWAWWATAKPRSRPHADREAKSEPAAEGSGRA